MIFELLFFFVIIVLCSAAYAGLRAAPWVPSKKNDIERVIQLAQIQPGQKFYDLGCGDGRILTAAAKKQALSYGIELSLLPYLAAKIRKQFQQERARITVLYKDFWHTNLSNADIVYFFLTPQIIPKLKQKFEKELQSRTTVISHVWPIDGWKPTKIDKRKDHPDIYYYHYQSNNNSN